MTTVQEVPEGERLARLEATVDYLVRKVGDVKSEVRDVRSAIRDLDSKMRTYFLWMLATLIGILAPSLIRFDRYTHTQGVARHSGRAANWTSGFGDKDMNHKETPHVVRRNGRVLARLGSADCVALR